MLITDSTPLDDRYYGDGPDEPREGSSGPQVQEAYENLRMIRQMMERSTKHSTLSGFSGILVGLWAIAGVAVTHWLILPQHHRVNHNLFLIALAATWTSVLALSIATDFIVTKSRAPRVGKHVFSKLGAHIVGAALPSFVVGTVLTLFFASQGRFDSVWPYWMLCNGLAICSVGLFSVRPVSYLGWAFVIAGAVSLFLPPSWGLWMIALSFGGFNIAYGLYTGVTRRDW